MRLVGGAEFVTGRAVQIGYVEVVTGHLDAGMPSAWQRFIRTAMSEGVIAEDERFSMHGRKHRGITGPEGNHGDKQDAAGHKSPTTTGRYDHDVPVVKPPRERRFFPCSFPCGTKKAPGQKPKCLFWWAHQDSNLEPRDYESPALTVEL